MKVLTLSSEGHNKESDFIYGKNGEIAMFSMFPQAEQTSMCGIDTRKFSTVVKVQDLSIDYDFYVELCSESIEKSMCTTIDGNGNFTIVLHKNFEFNIYSIVDDLLKKANNFESNCLLRIDGVNLYLHENSLNCTRRQKQIYDKLRQDAKIVHDNLRYYVLHSDTKQRIQTKTFDYFYSNNLIRKVNNEFQIR